MVVRTWRHQRTSGRAVGGPSLPRSVLSSAVLLFALAPLGAGLAVANDSGATRMSARGDHEPKAVYVDRANHICAAASQLVNDVLDAAYADTARSDAQPAEREQAVVDQVAPIIRGEISALRHLPAPRGDEAAVNTTRARSGSTVRGRPRIPSPGRPSWRPPTASTSVRSDRRTPTEDSSSSCWP
jgi:hypothetical protein